MRSFESMSTKEMIEAAKSKSYSMDEADAFVEALSNRLERETQPKCGQTKGQFMQHKMSDFLNNTLCDEKGFVNEIKRDHRTLQQSLFNLCLKVVKSFSEYTDYDYDGRNEASVRKAKIIVKALDEADESINCPFI